MKTISELQAELKTTRWIVVAIFIVAIIILLKNCFGKKEANPLPDVIPVSKQVEKIVHDSTMSKRERDSVNLKLKEANAKSDVWYDEWIKSQNNYQLLLQETNLTETVPDTCLEIQAKYVKQFEKIKAANAAKDLACENALKGKSSIILQKNALIELGKKETFNLRRSLDTALIQQTKLTKAVSSLKSKAELYAGIMAMGNEQKPLEGVGVSLGLRSKNGTQYEVFAMQLNGGVHYGVSYKKRLLKL